MASKRIEWIDLCKGIAICLVLLGHTLTNKVSLVYIYGFHMPLFFMLSGLVLGQSDTSFKQVVKKRFNSLVLPFIFFYLLTYIYWLLFERSYRSFEVEWWRPLLGLIYAGQHDGLMAHNGVLWFLPCLFMVELEYTLIKKIKNTTWEVLTIFILAIIGYSIKIVLPWCLNISFVALQFYYIGVKLRPLLIDNKPFTKNGGVFDKRVALISLIVCGGLYIFIQHRFEVIVNMTYNEVSNIWIFQLISYLGIFAVLALCILWRPRFTKRIWLFLGTNTLVIFAIHQPLIRIVRFLAGKISSQISLETSLSQAILADVLVLLILWPIIILFNKYRNRIFSPFKL